MYWRERPPTGKPPLDEKVILENKKHRYPDLLKLISEVTIDKEQLENELRERSEVRRKGRKPKEREDFQLEWAIKSAWGNLHLNCAIYFYAEPAEAAWKIKHQESLRLAYDAFQECAMLITPGVEMLTNLAKVCFELDRVQQGIHYLEQAIKLNPCYEYAYYRLAKVREEREELPELLSVLKRCQQSLSPAIAGLKELFRNYDAQLHPPIAKS
jgi:tetratricopeptide (TPR) repeat protein